MPQTREAGRLGCRVQVCFPLLRPPNALTCPPPRLPALPPCSIRAAHCLTSVQFSPGCGHMLLAYGKKHISLLRSLVADRGSVLPLHTIMEVFR